MDPADEEEVERPGVDADRDLQPHGPGRGRAPPHAGERLLHAGGGRAGAPRVVLAAEQQQDGVAAELEQVGVLGVGARDQLAERRVDHAGDLLRALAAALRERLGQLGEPGDVGEDERALEALGALLRRVAQPVDRDARHERPQEIHRRLEPCAGPVAHRRQAYRPLSVCERASRRVRSSAGA